MTQSATASTEITTRRVGRKVELPEVLPATADDLLEVQPGDAVEIAEVLPGDAPALAEVLPGDAPVLEPYDPPMGWLRWTWRLIASVSEWLFGVASLMGGLAVLAAIPVVQLLSFGYMLEAGGRIARTGRLRDGFFGMRKAARIGSIVVGIYLMLLPLWFISSFATSAELIAPGGPAAQGWRLGLVIMTTLMVAHISVACWRGGQLRYFFWPLGHPFFIYRRLRQGNVYRGARDAVWDFVVSLRLPYYFWLGLRGLIGAFIWLAVPVTMIALSRNVEAAIVLAKLSFAGLGGFMLARLMLKVPHVFSRGLRACARAGFQVLVAVLLVAVAFAVEGVGWAAFFSFIGAVLLAVAALYVPFLQVNFARQNRFRAMFEVGEVRRQYCRAPVAFTFWFFITLLFALPLYLLKIEMVPREAAWLPSLVFITFMFPARIMTGWAVARAQKREQPRLFLFRWSGRPLMFASAGFYVLIVFFTQYVSWYGIWSLYEQHAFMLPVPFFNLGN